MKHSTDIHRLLRIITLVQHRPDWDPDSLASELRITKRTVYRDIDKLRAVGVPIEFNKKKGCYSIQGEFFLQPLQLTPEEALALTAMCEHVAKSEQIPFLRPAARAIEKIRAQFPPEMELELARITDHMVIQTAPTAAAEGHADVYERIKSAIASQQALECRYESPRHADGDTFIFEPYALFYGVRAWYAIGRHGKHDQVRCLKLKRFGPMTPTDQTYTIPPGFSVRKYLRNAWAMIPGDSDHKVELRFEPSIAETLADTRWHGTQEIEEHPDGSITFRCTVSGLDEIVWWVLSFGPSCTVVAPRQLSDRVRDLAIRTAGLYTGASAETTNAPAAPAKRRK